MTLATTATAGESFLRQFAATSRFRLGEPSNVCPTPDGDAVLFLRSGPRSFVRDLYTLDVATGVEQRLASADTLLEGKSEELTDAELARRERMRLSARGIATFELSRDGKQLLIPLSGRLYLLDRQTRGVTQLEIDAETPIDARLSPDGAKAAFVSDGDLYVHDIASKTTRRLTHGADEDLSHGLAEFVAQEEMARMHGYWWSPDSRQIAYQQTDTADVERWLIADPANPAKPPTQWPYPRPGMTNAAVRLGVVSVDGGETHWVDWGSTDSAAGFPYLASVAWSDNAPLTLLVQNRTQTAERLLAVDPDTGGTRELLSETDDAWLNLEGSTPRWLADGASFLWASERSGAWRLELRSAEGALIRTLTPPGLGYRRVVHLDEAAGSVVVSGGPDPTQTQLFRVPLDGRGEPEPLTPAAGVYSAVYAKRGGVCVRTASGLAGPSQHVVLRGDGSRAGELRNVAETPPFEPNVELTKVGDGPGLYAAVVRPRDFDPSKKYPVLVNVYAGPHAQLVTHNGRGYLLNQWLADQGYVVVLIDGRGTPSRGRAWERVIKHNLIEAPLEDQVAGLQALGAKHPELDLARVGVYGWSFGGYCSAMAVMQRPDVFRVGVAGAPVADFRDYDTHYTERYLGLPEDNTAGYDASSVLTHADRLTRPLLIIHGTADDNVYFLHSVKMSNALLRAGRPHDFLPLMGQTHMVSEPEVVERMYQRMAGYFASHLQTE
ncbi:Prolyl tripeptidyl peptidase precursor [Pirellulimonas nuda]|uniref:Prolyl tripeptidyl peptidase n=2 Tax=Pirellulimonas nuda TaxID=2528009 RepID=A0A518DJH4_9BACT|nr:Prolyl tripeptidyl peptidase precursor [Pirellulimonas nuda]